MITIINFLFICKHVHMQIQLYAANQISSEHGYLGYVLRGCHTDPQKTVYTVTLHNDEKWLDISARVMLSVYAVGNFFLIILVLLVSVQFLNKQGSTLASSHNDSTAKSSFSNYGIFWGCVTVSFPGNVLMIVLTLMTEIVNLSSGALAHINTGWIVLGLLVLITSTTLIVAIYHGRKLSFAIPSIFLLPFAILCCCNGAHEISKKIVRCLSIWSLLLFLLHICCRSSFVFLALLGRPPTVISTTLLYILVVFYSVHLLAILFAFTKAKKKQPWRATVTSIFREFAQILVFLVLFMTAACFASLIGFAGVLANYRTVLNSPYSTLSALITPTIFLVFGWTLRKIGFQWLKSVTGPDELAVTEQLQEPLLQVGNSRDCAMSNEDSEQRVRERHSTLLSSFMQ